MALSKEFYLDEIRSKYPNSYNESLKDLPVKDLEDMLDFLEGALEKADGGSIGIEVLFGPKRGEYQTGGQAYDPRASAEDFAQAISKVGGGTTAQKLQDIGRYTTGQLGLTQQHFDNIAAMKSDPKKFGIDKQIDYAKLSGKDLVKGANPVLQPFVALGQGLASPIYDYYQALQKYSDKGYQGDFELSKKGILDFGKNLLRVGEEFAAQKPVQMAAGRTLGGLEAIQEGLSQFGTAAASTPSQLTSKPSQTFTADSEGYAAYQGIVPGFKARKRSDGRFEYKAPDGQIYGPDTYTDIAVGKYPNIYDPNKQKKADGGRVGLFMGGPALEGQALDIYNSMNAYGFSDQEIADALSARGLYTPGGSTDTNTTATTSPQTLGYQGGRDDQDRTFVDRQDYSFNKKNYAPGKQLEVNPAAFGISFEKASKPQGIINAALDLPGRTLTSFASPTTGGNIIGPAEEGFMSQVVDIDPAGRTREELRQQYDSYNRFFGAPSNFAAARTPGKFGQVLGTVIGAAAGIPFLGKGIDALSQMGGKDRSDRSLYAVDNVGFGQGTGRDEFGVFTGGKTLLGDTTSYGERMAERLGELDDFFSSRIEDFDINNLDASTLNKMSKINSFYTKQIQAYQQRLERDRINKAAELEKQRQQYLDSQTRKEVQDLQNRINRGDFDSTSSIPDRDRGNVTTASAAKTSKVGGGGYTKSDSTRDSYRGRYNRGGLATMFTRRR